MALFKQIIGRGTRLFPDEDKLSFDIIDYSGATALFSDPEFDGPPEQVVDEEIDDEGNVTERAVVERAGADLRATDGRCADDIAADDARREPRDKFYVDDAEVWVTAEAVYHLDPATERLRLVEYRDFVAETVGRSSPTPATCARSGRRRVGRQDVLDALAAHGIDLDELVERTGMADADPLDVLVPPRLEPAARDPASSARDASAVSTSDFFEAFQPAAREVLAVLARQVRRARHRPARRPRRARGAAAVVSRDAGEIAAPVRLEPMRCVDSRLRAFERARVRRLSRRGADRWPDRRRPTPPRTTPQAKLAAVIKSARDAMRKDAGLNGDLDRIPQLAWLLFLKAFDGLEQIEPRGHRRRTFRPAIEPPYRWRDWAADPNGPTGDALLRSSTTSCCPYLRGSDRHRRTA